MAALRKTREKNPEYFAKIRKLTSLEELTISNQFNNVNYLII